MVSNFDFSFGFIGSGSKVFPDSTWLATQAPFTLSGVSKPAYRVDLAQSIRDGAGLPASETAGIVGSVGLTDSGSLTAGSKLAITNETQVQSIASSGSGTEADPYIIEDKDYNGAGATNWGHRFNNGSLNIYIEFQNCRFRNYTSQCLWIDNWGTGKITFRNCEFYNTSTNAYLILFENAKALRIVDSTIKGGLGQFYQIGATTTESGQTLELENIEISSDEGNYTSGVDVFKVSNGNCTVTASNIEVKSGTPNNGQRAVFGLVDCEDGSTFTNLKGADGFDHFFHDEDGTVGQKSITIQYFDISDTDEEPIRFTGLLNSEISYGEVADSGAGFRLIYLLSDSAAKSNGYIESVDVHHVKATKTTGNSAGDECIESIRGKDVTFRYCWVTECTEDAYEHADVISGCTVEYCVADNCDGQIVDYFHQWDESAWVRETDVSTLDDSEGYVHHIYGDCADWVLIVNALKGLYFHDIYATNTDSSTKSSIRIADRDSVVVRDIKGAGPLPLQADRGNGSSTSAVDIVGGSDIEVRYFDNQNGVSPLTTDTN